jgi:hypothetical protein
MRGLCQRCHSLALMDHALCVISQPDVRCFRDECETEISRATPTHIAHAQLAYALRASCTWSLRREKILRMRSPHSLLHRRHSRYFGLHRPLISYSESRYYRRNATRCAENLLSTNTVLRFVGLLSQHRFNIASVSRHTHATSRLDFVW